MKFEMLAASAGQDSALTGVESSMAQSANAKTTTTTDTAEMASATREALSKFEYMDENEYKGSALGMAPRDEFFPCVCSVEEDDPETACGLRSECINRALFIECKDSCPCGEKCKNKRFRRKEYAPIEIIDCGPKGFGIRATQDLPANTFVIEYIGEVVSKSTFIKRTRQYSESGQRHHYFMSLKIDEVIDATRRGGIARFINHSCNPNCVLQKWIVGKYLRMGIFTKVAVPKGTELTFDYKFERYGATAQKCLCGEPNCKGIIGVVKKQNGEAAAAAAAVAATADDSDDSGFDSDVSPGTIADNQQLYPETDESDAETTKKSRALQSADEVTRFIPKMYRCLKKKDGKRRAMHCLDKLEATSDGDLLKQFLNTHGLRLLKLYWQEFFNDTPVLRKVLLVLQKLPITTRNTIEELKIEAGLQRAIEETHDIIVKTLSEDLIRKWSALTLEYRIPKRMRNPENTGISRENTEDGSQRSHSTPGSPYDRDAGSQMKRFTDYQRRPRFGDCRRNSNSGSTDSYPSRSSFANPRPVAFVDDGQVPLPTNWTRHYDDRQGKYFYRHSRTGVTQWDFPRASPEDEQAQAVDQNNGSQQTFSSAHTVSSETIEQLLNAAKQNFKAGLIPLTEEEKARKKKKEEQKRKQEQREKSKLGVDSSSKKLKTGTDASEKAVPSEMKKELREEFASVVLKFFSRYKDSMPPDDFKKHARKITHMIIEKESRDKQIISIDEDVRRKVRKFVEQYASKLNQGASHS